MISSPSTSSAAAAATAVKPSSSANPGKRGGGERCRWRTPGQQRVYNRRLIDALRGPRRPASARAIKDAADSALALTARGQSRWSRAILTSRPRVLLKAGGKVRRKKPRKPAKKPVGAAEAKDQGTSKERKVRERLRRLGRLVPGCGKLPAAPLLEEAADYVAALEMQVRAMRMLAEALSAAALTSPADEQQDLDADPQIPPPTATD